MLYGDGRDEWNGNLLADARVRHYWDEKDRIGLELAGRRVGGLGGGVVWDAFFVFGRDATWIDEPAPVVASGSNVIDHTAEFAAGVRRVRG